MNSEALETFLAVHRRGGVSAAAIALSRTQSAISRRLALLEREVGAPLFERVGRGLVLSDVGAALLVHAQRVVAAVGDARAAAQEARSGGGAIVRVAVVGTLANPALAAALGRVRARFPGMDLQLQTATSAEVSDKVRAGDATIGVRYFEDTSPDLDCRVLRQERLVVACATTHALAGRRLKSLNELAKERWLAFPVQPRNGEAFAAHVFAQFAVRGIDRIDWIAIDSLTAQKRLVEAGFGIALLQADAIGEELARGDIALIRVGGLDAAVPVARVVRRGSYLGAAAQALLRELERPTRRPAP